MMKLTAVISLLAILIFCNALPAAEKAIEEIFPPGGIKGWIMEGKAKQYTAENLYTYINGEAELYIPYGFEVLGSAIYVRIGNRDMSLAADIFRMRSPLDAFGIYAYYRDPDADDAGAGGEGFIDDSQVMFYKDRYFVRISASGAGNPERPELNAFARAIAEVIPGQSVRPRELEILKAPGMVPRTEKYIAQSLMGYAFFKRGLTAEANINKEAVKAFVVFNDSEAAAGNAIDDYLRYLKEKGMKAESVRNKDSITLVTQDPLYKGVMVKQTGHCLIGVAGAGNPTHGSALIEQLQMHDLCKSQ